MCIRDRRIGRRLEICEPIDECQSRPVEDLELLLDTDGEIPTLLEDPTYVLEHAQGDLRCCGHSNRPWRAGSCMDPPKALVYQLPQDRNDPNRRIPGAAPPHSGPGRRTRRPLARGGSSGRDRALPKA